MRTRVRGGVAVMLSKHMLIVRKYHVPMLKGNPPGDGQSLPPWLALGRRGQMLQGSSFVLWRSVWLCLPQFSLVSVCVWAEQVDLEASMALWHLGKATLTFLPGLTSLAPELSVLAGLLSCPTSSPPGKRASGIALLSLTWRGGSACYLERPRTPVAIFSRSQNLLPQ